MQRSLDPSFRRDLLRFFCFLLALVAAGIVFLGTPALSTPTLWAIVMATLFSPWVAFLERKGFSRVSAILILFAGLLALGVDTGIFIARNWQIEWFTFQEKAPNYFSAAIGKVADIENQLKAGHPFLRGLHVASSLSAWGNRTGGWFADELPSMMSGLLSSLFLVPLLTFFFLSEGRTLRRKFFQLVPNRFFESVFLVSHGVSSALSDYLRAKIIEAFLVGSITGIGLGLVHSEYAIVLGFWAGLTNIVPYLGPILGAVPGIAIAAMDSHGGTGAVWATGSVYGLAYLIDAAMIFPGVVAKLVNLPPLVLIASVVLGQYYGGIVGMLISIPIVAALKVVLSELYFIIYGFVPDP